MDNLRAIIFDADGVIFDSEKLWDIGDGDFLARRGLNSFPIGLKPRLAGTSILEGTAMLLESAGSVENIGEAAKERIAIMEKLYASSIEYMPGFIKFLDYVKKKPLKTAVATSMSRNLFPIINERLNFLDLFDNKVFSVSEVNRAKPAPDIYLYAAKKIGVSPEECVVIEDAPNGIKAAKAAGMFCIGLSSTFDKENLLQADVVFKTFNEIEYFVNTL